MRPQKIAANSSAVIPGQSTNCATVLCRNGVGDFAAEEAPGAVAALIQRLEFSRGTRAPIQCSSYLAIMFIESFQQTLMGRL